MSPFGPASGYAAPAPAASATDPAGPAPAASAPAAPAAAPAAQPLTGPRPTPALASVGVTRRLAWAIVLAAAALLLAFMPAAPLNVGASGVLALAGIIVLIIDRVREPSSGRGLLVSLVALVVLLGSVGLAFLLIGPLNALADFLAGA